MAKKKTEVLSYRAGRDIKPLTMDDAAVAAHHFLANVGINFAPQIIHRMMAGIGMDGNDTGLTPAPLIGLTPGSITTPVQFLQNWLPGFVRVITAARKIDACIGIMVAGAWDDEEVVQGLLEPLGTAQPYSDYGNVPVGSWNTIFESRTVVRFEQGLLVGLLEEARAARIRIATAAEKRSQAADALDIQRNRVGFYGYNDGSGRTYGLLNEPFLPAYVTVAENGAGTSTLWANKTFLEITADIRSWLAALQNSSLDRIDVEEVDITMILATVVNQFTTVTTDLGYSIREWMQKNYPKVRFITAPELNGANGGANVAYIFADKVEDGSSDGSQTFIQVVPAQFQALGVEKRSKSYIEDFANATAGVMCKRPYAVYRASGI